MSWMQIPGWSCHELRRWYRHVAETIPTGGRLVELGVAYGASLAYFAECLEVLKRDDVELFAVDVWREHMGGGQLPPEVWERLLAHGDALAACKAELRDFAPMVLRRAGFIRGTAVAAADCFPDRSVDVVFIDEDHTRESVSGAIRAWLPKLRPRGILSGHDCNPHYPGILEAVNELLPDAEVRPPHVDDHGWGGVWIWRSPR